MGDVLLFQRKKEIFLSEAVVSPRVSFHNITSSCPLSCFFCAKIPGNYVQKVDWRDENSAKNRIRDEKFCSLVTLFIFCVLFLCGKRGVVMLMKK